MKNIECHDIAFYEDGTIVNNYDYMLSKSLDYISLMNQVVTLEDESYKEEIPDLFALNLQKIANGKILLESRNDLAIQLLSVREKCGKAEITLLDTVVSPYDSASVIRFIFTTEKIGTYTTMAILHFNSDGEIDKINEVFNVYNDGW